MIISVLLTGRDVFFRLARRQVSAPKKKEIPKKRQI